jgi:hypothetical protein
VTIAEAAQLAQPRRLRIVFFAGGPKFDFAQYTSLIEELGRRGHEVHLAFSRLPTGRPLALVERIMATSPSLSYGVTPKRGRLDGWRPVAWAVRGLADLARYAHPRYEQAPVLRERMATTILGRLQSSDLEPIGRRVALRLARRLAATNDAELSARVIRRLATLENAIPTSRHVDRYLRDRAPDAVLATAVVKKTVQVEYLKSARRLRIPAGICVASWDNLTNKGLLKVASERVFVWNEVQRREAIDLHGIPGDRVVATGAQLFDEWFARRPTSPREEFLGKIGLDPGRPYVLYVGSSAFITERGGEVEFVLRWIESLRRSGDERLRGLGVAIRPHPGVPRRWRKADLSRLGNAVVWPAEGATPVTEDKRADFFDSLTHSAAVVGINTTAMIDAAIVGKSVLTILAPEFAQEDTLHFHYLLEENGGFLHVASSFEEHAAQLRRVLDEGPEDAERRRRFVESFVRPHGLDRPATPILADAVEELATVPVSEPARPGRLLLRAPLALEAALASVIVTRRHAASGLRRLRPQGLRRRVGAKARRYGLLGGRS